MEDKLYSKAEMQLISALGHGEKEGRTQSELTVITKFDSRTTRKLFESVRRKGGVICATNAGRFLPETVEELRRYVKRVRASAESELAALAAAERLLEKWEAGIFE